MSGFVVFIIIIAAWAIFGSLKAFEDKINRGQRPTSMRMVQKSPPKLANKPTKMFNNDYRVNPGQLKVDEMIVDVPSPKMDVEQDIIKESSSQENQLTPLFKGDRLIESIILAECLDRPRAYRPHPLNKQKNMLQSRD